MKPPVKRQSKKKQTGYEAAPPPTFERDNTLMLPDHLLPFLDAAPHHADELKNLVEEARIVRGRFRLEGRAGDLPEEKLKRAVVIGMALFGNMSRAADVILVPVRRVHTWLRNDAAFKEDLSIAEQEFYDRGEEAMWARVMAPDASRDRGSALLTTFALKGARPLRYRDTAPLFAATTPKASLDAGVDNPYLLPEGGPGLAELLLAPPARSETEAVEGEFREDPT